MTSKILMLMSEAGVCEKTAKKALEHGAESIRGLTGERVAEAAKRLGIELPKPKAPIS